MTTYRRARRSGDDGPTVSLFPFLAVLLCTMGMLVMILVLVSRNSGGDRETARTLPAEDRFAKADLEPTPTPAPEDELFLTPLPPLEAPESSPMEPPLAKEEEKEPEPVKPAPKTEEERQYEALRAKYQGATREEILSETENADWFLSELQKVRKRTDAALVEERRKLSETEAQIAQMVEQLVDLNQKAIEINGTDEAGEKKSETPDALKKEIERRAAEIARLTAEVEKLREKAKESEGAKSYAILPYRGKSGTFRRPIYIECTEHGIYLMPEEIPFVPDDFLVAKYPGNPFDAALRSARQYYMENGQGDDENEPYPLLIIRPGAAQSYYAAKAALASWGGDFGYEFVEEDWKLEYPKRDPELTRRVEEQLIISRSRMAVPLAAIKGELERAGEGSDGGTRGGRGHSGGTARTPSGSESVFAGGSNGSPMTDGGAGDGIAAQLGPYAKISGTNANPGSSSYVGETTENGLHEAGSLKKMGSLPSQNRPSLGDKDPVYGQNSPTAPLPLGAPSLDALGGYRTAGIDPGYAGDANGSSVSAAPAVSAAPLPSAAPVALPPTAQEQVSAPLIPGASQSIPPVEAAASHAASPYTPFAEGSADAASANASMAETVPDLRQTVGNTAFPDRGSLSASDAKGGADSGMPEKMPEKTPNKPPKVAETKIEGAINLRAEFSKPSQMAIERPISVECRADRIVFPAQTGLPGGREILLSAGDSEAQILSTIVFCVKSWRVAGRNMYWSPWIKVKVTPEGKASYDWLAALMKSQQVRMGRVE